MKSRIKSRLSIYGIISGISYIYLILIPNPGISIPIFFVIQMVSLYLIVKGNPEVKNIKGLWVMAPIFIISLNNLISTANLLGPVNFLVIVFLYSVMILIMNDKLSLKKLNIYGILKAAVNVFEPLISFNVPLKWIAERTKNKGKNIFVKRILLGIAVSIPCVLFLVTMLSSADMVFYNDFVSFNKWISELLNFIYIFKIIIGTFVGLYLFGHLYSVFDKGHSSIVNPEGKNSFAAMHIKGDAVVLNILLVSILTIYTIFITIQFRYLFSSGELPYGLNYAEYARRGFFELVFLSVLNIALILLVTYLLKDKIYVEKSIWSSATKIMLAYLCIITGIMLVSSYFRMSLYDSAYGFTRLRILVYTFLIFEGLVLTATLIYIIKHNFNIFAVYAASALVFYLALNLVKIDGIIAERNIDMYFAGQTESLDMDYLMSLSADAAPQIMRLLDKDVEIITRNMARIYMERLNELYSGNEYNWRSYNLPAKKTRELLTVNKDKIKFIY